MIHVKRNVLSSRPIFVGTRIPVKTIASVIAAGASNDEILRNYPSLYIGKIRLTLKLSKEVSSITPPTEGDAA